MSDPAFNELFSRVGQLEKDNAVTMDRTSRHDEEIRALSLDVKQISQEMTVLKGTVEAGFRETAVSHRQTLESNRVLAQSMDALAADVKANNTKRIEWSVVLRVLGWTVGPVIAVVAIGARFLK